MSQTLTLELSDEVYTAIRHQAETVGTSPAQWIVTTLERQYGKVRDWQSARTQRTEAEKQVARDRFERHFGEVDLGYATGVDNEQIDADLAREYAATHEAN
jgi:predicted transcriptional regulator